MAFPAVPKRRPFGKTRRRDAWWLLPGSVGERFPFDRIPMAAMNDELTSLVEEMG